MPDPTRTLIRPSTPADLPAIVEIYRWNVLHGTGTFELEAPDLVLERLNAFLERS